MATNSVPNTTTGDKRYITSPYAKFAIGSIAGFAAISFPRMALYLSSSSTIPIAQFFPFNFMLVVAAFSLLIGAVITIMEYGHAKLPKDTFYTALAVPGLIAGSFNGANSNGDQEYAQLQNLMHKITQEHALEEREISVPNKEVISLDELFQNPITYLEQSHFNIGFFAMAYAATSGERLTPKQSGMGLAIQREVPEYAISLKQFDDIHSARSQLTGLREKLPNSAVLVKTENNGYELLLSKELMTKSEALATIIELKQKSPAQSEQAINPIMVKIK